MSIKVDFKNYIKKKKEERNLAKLNHQMKVDIKQAKILLDKKDGFKIEIHGILNGNRLDRIIDDHNFEYCFFGAIWKSLSNPERIALMVKFSQKYISDYPLSLDSFMVSDNINDDEPLVLYNSLDSSFFVLYNHIDFNNGLNVLRDLVGYKDRAKENLFIEYIKKSHNLSDFDGVWQLRYYYKDDEHLLLDQYPEILNDKNINKNEVIQALKFDSVENQMQSRITLKQLEILEKANYFMPEFDDFLQTYKDLSLHFEKRYKEMADKYLGDEKQRDLNFLKTFNNDYLKGKYSIEELEKMFKPGKRPELDEDPFPNIELPKEIKMEL